MGDFWVFGYGSLMWRPGFDHLGAVRAHLHGYHRALCVRSYVHRGTEQRPGLVLGLDKGGSCVGLAFRVDTDKRAATIAYLRERELVTHVYKERMLRATLETGQAVEVIGIWMAVYLSISVLTSMFMNWYNSHIALVER